MPPAKDETPLLQGLPPVLPSRPRLLILGSMPGAASLHAGQYYAHPRNAFWPVAMSLLGRDQAPADYSDRLALLRRAGIALWDVLAGCRRKGSLDQAIDADSEIPNDIAALLHRHPQLHLVACNGQKAGQAFRKHIAPRLETATHQRLELLILPSTSPAHAGMSAGQKAHIWRREVFARLSFSA